MQTGPYFNVLMASAVSNTGANVYFEMRPFTKSAIVADNWPSSSELPKDQPIGLTMGWVNFPYLSNGKFTAGPIALEAHAGDWHAQAPFTARGSTGTSLSNGR
jgi:hypothetical protein